VPTRRRRQVVGLQLEAAARVHRRCVGMYYYFGTIAVDAYDNVALGFSGSSLSQYVGAYLTGRNHSDSLGAMRAPVRYRDGAACYYNSNGGTNCTNVVTNPVPLRRTAGAITARPWRTLLRRGSFGRCRSPPTV